MSNQLRDVAERWTALGRRDAMWAALTERPGSDGWDRAQFLDTGRSEIDHVLAMLARRGVPVRRGAALDFGCGPGRLSAGLAAAGFERVTGVDVSGTMLAKARELVPDARCEFVHNTRPDLDLLDDDSVDLVYSCRVLQHLPPPLAHGYIREFFRVARPGSPVVFQVPAEPAGGAVGTILRLAPDPLLDRARGGMQMHGTSPAEISRLVADAGGVTVSIEEDRSAGPRWRSHLYLTQVRG